MNSVIQKTQWNCKTWFKKIEKHNSGGASAPPCTCLWAPLEIHSHCCKTLTNRLLFPTV